MDLTETECRCFQQHRDRHIGGLDQMIQKHLRVVALMRLFPDGEPFDLVMFLVLSAHSKKGRDVSVRPRFWLRLCEPHF